MAGFIQIKLDHSFVRSRFGGRVTSLASSVDKQLRTRAYA